MLIQEYIIALTNLYGVVTKEKVLEIYNDQNEEKLTLDALEVFINKKEDELIDAFVYLIDGYLVHQAIWFTESLEEMLNEKTGKPYYIPEKKELLKYVDGNYFEKTKEYLALLTFVQRHFLEDLEEAEELCEEIHGLKQMQVRVQEVFETLNRKNIGFENDEQLNEFIMIVSKMANNIRIWENNGFTPNEIFNKYEKPHLRPLPEKPFNFKKEEKPGRNDPCHCGSGRKYKKCCLRKDEEK
jgi:preprotein translocase subunit SecA